MSNICRNFDIPNRKKNREDNKEDRQRKQRLRMTKSNINTHEHNKSILWSRGLELVILASERISEIGIQPIERILPKVLHLIP